MTINNLTMIIEYVCGDDLWRNGNFFYFMYWKLKQQLKPWNVHPKLGCYTKKSDGQFNGFLLISFMTWQTNHDIRNKVKDVHKNTYEVEIFFS